MRILLTAFLAAILLASCQKEVSFQSGSNGNNGGNGNGNGNGNTSGLLVKVVAVTVPKHKPLSTLTTHKTEWKL